MSPKTKQRPYEEVAAIATADMMKQYEATHLSKKEAPGSQIARTFIPEVAEAADDLTEMLVPARGPLFPDLFDLTHVAGLSRIICMI